jgi:hypothetical protein
MKQASRAIYIYIYSCCFKRNPLKDICKIPSIRQNLAEFLGLEANAVLITASTTPNVVESN